MPYNNIYSRDFLEKVSSWPRPFRDMAFQAADHVAQDPHLHDYQRTYLTPYRQKHPTTNHQYTLFFIMPSADIIFFAWINDSTCLHETRANYPDPCLKEFERLLSRNEIEKFDPLFHEINFEIHPNKSKPIRCRSQFLGQETTLNTYLAGPNSFIGHAFHCDEMNLDIAKRHVEMFLNKLHGELSLSKVAFEFTLHKLGLQHEISLLTYSHDPNKWEIIPDPDDFILRKK